MTRIACRLGLLLALACNGAMAQIDAKALTERAEAAFRTGDLIVAMGLLRQAADAGHGPAQSRLADMLDAAEQDAEAVVWYRKAAAQNDAHGEYGLGRMLAHGEGVARDPVEAVRWYRLAAEKNHVFAIEALARAHRSGDLGIERNLAEADRLEQRAKTLRDAAKKP
ncbi:tetratricopeptide repeat protein [Ideonella sp. A 288]|uniref:tetratricopeptide repeat protein n=1 Tax=Ideonella sp. A 288 TaxID=1962181 RepID=UPI0028735BBB|nr:tetratricopeptide repeat protein [Ideonella sp. A 288]